MKIFLKIVKVTFLVLLALIVIAISTFVYFERFHKTEIYRESSPDGLHTFVLCQVGSPGWPFGPVKAEIRVLNAKGRTVAKEAFWVNNDGGSLYEFNIKAIRWYEAKLELDLKGADDPTPTTYVLNW